VVRRGLLIFAALVALAGLGLLQLAGGGEAALPDPPEGSDPGSVSFEIPEIHPLLTQHSPSWAPRSRRRSPARQRRRPLAASHAPAPIPMPEQEPAGGGSESAPVSTAGAAPGARVTPPPPPVFMPTPFLPLELVTAPPVSRPADELEVAVSRSVSTSSQVAQSSTESDHVHPPEAVSPDPAPAVSALPSLERSVVETLPVGEVVSVSHSPERTVTEKLQAREVVSVSHSPERTTAEKLFTREVVPARLSPKRAAAAELPGREDASGPARVTPETKPPAEAPQSPSSVLAVGRQVDLEDLDRVPFSQSILVQASGVLGGSGMISGRLMNRGTVSPGHSPGLLEIAGDFSQSADARLDIELAGTSPEDFDRIIVEGIATLSGVIEVLLIDGFFPRAGDSFAVLMAERIVDEGVSFVLPALGAGSALSAGILDLGGTQVLELSTTSATQLAAVPEASTALLLVVGLGGLAALRRLRV